MEDGCPAMSPALRRTHDGDCGYGRDRRVQGRAGLPAHPPRGLGRGPRGLPLAPPGTLQLGARLVRRHRPRQRPHRPAHRGGGRHDRTAVLRRAVGALGPGRELAARTRGARRGPGAGHAGKPGGAVGDHARRDEAARRRHPRDPAARSGRSAGPGRARPRPARRRTGVGRREVRRGARPLHACRGGRRRRGLAAVRGRLRGAGRVRPGRAHPFGRPADAVLHLRHHRPPQTGRAHPHLVPGRPPRDDVLDRAEARRRAPEHLLTRLGQARLVQPVRAVERRGDRLPVQLHPLRRGPADGRDGQGPGHHLLRPAHRVAHAHPGRPEPVADPPPRGRRRR